MRLTAWLWCRFRPPEGRFLFFLLVLAALSAALGGMAAAWVPGDELFLHTALLGVLIGRRLRRTRMRGRWAAPLLAAGGVVYVVEYRGNNAKHNCKSKFIPKLYRYRPF